MRERGEPKGETSREREREPFLKFIAGLRSSVARPERREERMGGEAGEAGRVSWRTVRLNIKRVGKFGAASRG